MNAADAILERMRADSASDWPERLLDDMLHARASSDPSDGELQTLRCLSHGMSEPMAADAQHLTLWAVQAHTKSVRHKLGAKTTLHAACEAIRLGLIA